MTLNVAHVFLQRGNNIHAAIHLTYSDCHMTHRTFDRAEILNIDEYGKELITLKPPSSIEVMLPSEFTRRWPDHGFAGLQPLLRAVCSEHGHGQMTLWDEQPATIRAWEITLGTTGIASLVPIVPEQIYQSPNMTLLPDNLLRPRRAA